MLLNVCFTGRTLPISCRGGSRIFFRRGCTPLLLYFNTNKPHSFFFCRIPVVLENRRSSQGGGGGAYPLHPPLDPPLSCYTQKQQAGPKFQRGCSSNKTALLSVAPLHFFLVCRSFLAMMVILLSYNVKLTCRLVFTTVLQDIPFSMFTLQSRKSLWFTSVNTSSWYRLCRLAFAHSII